MDRPRRLRLALIGAAALVCLSAVTALALINPNFTPNDLVEQSETILAVKLHKPNDKQQVKMEVVRVLKGKKPEGDLLMDLSAASQKAWAEHVGKLAAARGDDPVPLFIGKYREQDEGEEVEALEAGLLQIDRDWVVMDRGKDKGVWNMSHVDTKKQGTWDGGSDMLILAVAYLKDNPDDRVPVEIGCDWLETKKPGKVEGKVSTACAVDLDGKGKPALYVAATGGDRLYLWGGKDFTDATGARKLSAKSAAAAWADFDGDGKLDLASWDGAALKVHLQGADGFGGKKIDAGFKPDGKVLSMLAVDAGVKGRPGVLVGTDKGPVLLTPADGGFKAAALAAPPADLGAASPRVVADLDGDGLYDVLQAFEKDGVVWTGKGGGKFEAPRKVGVATGKGVSRCCVGDYDADGLLEVYMIGPDCVRFWSNKGKLKFVDAFGHSGEMCYTAQPGGTGAGTCDLNNDGLQDIWVTYSSDLVHHYFNRGFRSFGKSLSTNWEHEEVQADTADGQQAGVFEDLNDDGGQDMALVLTNGNVLVYLREVWEDEPPLSLRAVLAPKSPYAGPITVTGWNDKRCLGAWNLTAGSAGAPFCLAAPGKVKLKWKFPGGEEQTKTVELEEEREVLRITGG
ncbi:MAG: FG-GAP repeat domain-containing protein [Planctomycetota bacterium]|jgi:hypothetical protein